MTPDADTYARFHADVSSRSLALDMLKEHYFVEHVGDILAEVGEIGEFTRAPYLGRGMKVDGYHYNEEFGELGLVVSIWRDDSYESSNRITNTEVEDAFQRCLNFFVKSRANLFERIDVANEAHDLARLIMEERNNISSVSIILVTDGKVTKRAAEIETVDGVEIKKIVWDITRILDYLDTGERETIEVDFGEDKQISCLFVKDHDGRYTTYLAFIPGDTLADLYSIHGTKMLEMNVRVFLTARGKVNRGIRETIVLNPDMFCAYNNGITVFARNLDFIPAGDRMGFLRRATDFQIVNGGQTVASLHHAKRKQKADLSHVIVPMKLVSIERAEDVDILVPRISEYSNTQNKVSLSDLAANDKPHPELHELSRRLWAPDRTGGSRTTHWFYEKARGSYEETRRLEARTDAQRREFDAINPKAQSFDKGILGKVWNTYLMRPFTVSTGAQKNFVDFNLWLKDQQGDLEPFFRQTVALLILWNDTEKIVRKLKFEGYRHNIVTYTLAWLFKLTHSMVDLDLIWQRQDSGDMIRSTVADMCQIVNSHIRDTQLNITEYCKKEECWKLLLEREYELPDEIGACLIEEKAAVKTYDPRKRDEREAIQFCTSIPSKTWFELAVWLKQHDFLTTKARSQCYNMGKSCSKGKEPSIALSLACRKVWEDAIIRGWSDKPEGS